MAGNHTIVFLRRGFLSFCGRKPVASAEKKSTKHGSKLQGIKIAWSPRHAFRPHSLILFRSFGKCARRILEVTLAKTRFCFALLHFFGCSVTLPAATHDEREVVSSCISRVLSSRSGLRVHFTFLPKQKHFTFRQKEGRADVIALSAEKFHVRSKGKQFRLMLIVPLRRTSGCSVTLPV